MKQPNHFHTPNCPTGFSQCPTPTCLHMKDSFFLGNDSFNLVFHKGARKKEHPNILKTKHNTSAFALVNYNY